MRREAGQIGAPYRFIAYSVILFAVIGLDQWTKFLTRTAFRPGESVPLADGVLSLTFVMNRGAAFGMFSSQSRFLVFFPLLVSVGILVAALVIDLSGVCKVAMVCIAAGGISNALDRIFLGYVTDMVAVSFFPPVFNVADIFVTVGCVCFGLCILLGREEGNEAQP